MNMAYFLNVRFTNYTFASLAEMSRISLLKLLYYVPAFAINMFGDLLTGISFHFHQCTFECNDDKCLCFAFALKNNKLN